MAEVGGLGWEVGEGEGLEWDLGGEGEGLFGLLRCSVVGVGVGLGGIGGLVDGRHFGPCLMWSTRLIVPNCQAD